MDCSLANNTFVEYYCYEIIKQISKKSNMANLIKSESPDFYDQEKQIGLEITTAIPKQIRHFWDKLSHNTERDCLLWFKKESLLREKYKIPELTPDYYLQNIEKAIIDKINKCTKYKPCAYLSLCIYINFPLFWNPISKNELNTLQKLLTLLPQYAFKGFTDIYIISHNTVFSYIFTCPDNWKIRFLTEKELKIVKESAEQQINKKQIK